LKEEPLKAEEKELLEGHSKLYAELVEKASSREKMG
jgi:hypothetical protein